MSSGPPTSGDVVVIGAGCNGLCCAALLAKAGRKVTVIERRDQLGGLAAGDPLDGTACAGLWHETAMLRPQVVRDLELERHGLSVMDPPPVFIPRTDGPGLLLDHDPARSAGPIGDHSRHDADAYARYRRFIDQVRPVLTRVLDRRPPDILSTHARDVFGLLADGWALRRLGRSAMSDLLRVPAMCAADWMAEWFESQPLRCGLTLPALLGTFSGPWSPGSAGVLLRSEVMTGKCCAGGPVGLVAALTSAARSAGVEIRTGAGVNRIRVKNDRVLGVTLDSGESIDAPIVAVSCDPKTALLKLVSARHLPARLVRHLTAYRCTGTTAKLDLVLASPLRFAGLAQTAVERVRVVGPSIDDMERAFDAVKYNRASDQPLLDIYAPPAASAHTPSGCAPTGDAPGDRANPSASHNAPHDEGCYVSIIAHFAPYHLEGGWDDTARNRLADAIIRTLDAYAPGAASSVRSRRVLSPPDIARRFGVWEGHIHHGEPGLDQLIVRPVPRCARYRTPIEGLYLCGSGSHPGGGLTCGPGWLAASTITSGPSGK